MVKRKRLKRKSKTAKGIFDELDSMRIYMIPTDRKIIARVGDVLLNKATRKQLRKKWGG